MTLDEMNQSMRLIEQYFGVSPKFYPGFTDNYILTLTHYNSQYTFDNFYEFLQFLNTKKLITLEEAVLYRLQT